MPNLLTVKAAAEAMNLSQATIRSWILHRKISYTKIGGSVRIPLSAIEQLVSAGTVPAREKGECHV